MKRTITALLTLVLAAGCSAPAAETQIYNGGNAEDFVITPQPDESAAANPGEFDISKLSFEQFDEFYGRLPQDGLWDDIIREPLGNANGVWRYNLKFNSVEGGSGLLNEIGFAEVSVRNENNPPVQIVLHPRLASDGSEIWEESDQSVGYEPFGGGLDENNNMKLTGNDCVLVLEQFFAYEGREYLMGTLWLSEETTAPFLLIRGQD